MDTSAHLYKYIAILRCRTWGMWPEGERIISTGLRYLTSQNKDVSLGFSIHLVSYESRPRPENELPNPCSKYDSPIVWQGKMETGYWVGDLLLKAPEDKLKIEFDHKGPFQGEIDIQMHMGTTSELENELLITFSNTICHSVVSFLNITLGEYLVPVTPVQIRALQPGGSTFENSVQMKCVSRPVLEKKQLEECLSNYIAYRQSTDKEEERTMDTAMRRYLSAQNERDVVDKYCDLWESCEFVTYNVKAKGQKVGRIAQALANHISKTGRKISKANVEKLLDIKGLYNVRGQIVHNAVDKPEYIKDKIALLNELALELIRYKLGLPYQGNQTIDKFII